MFWEGKLHQYQNIIIMGKDVCFLYVTQNDK